MRKTICIEVGNFAVISKPYNVHRRDVPFDIELPYHHYYVEFFVFKGYYESINFNVKLVHFYLKIRRLQNNTHSHVQSADQ